MTDQILLFANIIAWAVLAIASIRALAVFLNAITDTRVGPDHPISHRRGMVFWQSLVLAFIAAAWLCAGRFA